MKETIKQHVFRQFEQILPTPQQVIVGVSGGPDSMLLADLLIQYVTKKNWDLSQILIATYNHGQRTESLDEQEFLKEYFADQTVYRNLDIPKKGLSETKLRTLRHQFFQDVATDSGAKLLFLGHNLTDRIETSTLNMLRGASVDGFLGIKPTSVSGKVHIYRPLLGVAKSDIQHYCDKHNISYFIDPTNIQAITPRNVLRNKSFPELYTFHQSGEKNRYESRRTIFSSFDQHRSQENSLSVQKTFHTPHHLRGVTQWFSVPLSAITYDFLAELYKAKKYVTKKILGEIHTFLHNPTAQGYKYFAGWAVFVVGNTVHFLEGTEKFWEKKHSQQKTIKQSGLLQFDTNIYTMQPEWIGYTIRYPQSGDIYKGKRVLKTMLNQKIPVFMRNTTPVIADGHTIKAILI